MTKYQLIILFLLVVSILSTAFEYAGEKKGLMSQLHKIFEVLMLIAILLIGYRAFFLIR